MNNFLKKIRTQAAKNPKTIVFSEGEEPKVLQAIEVIQHQKIAKVILIGDKEKIKKNAKKLSLEIDWKTIRIENPLNSALRTKYIDTLIELRKNKGMDRKQATKLIDNIYYFGAMMVQCEDADGMVTGSSCSTGDSMRPVFEIIKTKEKFHKVSGIFFMVMEKRLLLFADTAITIDPNSHDLKDIAIDTAETAKKFGIKPKVALVSFSTKGSNSHPDLQKVREAVALIKEERPDLIVDGELQVDAALVPSVAAQKCPQSPIQGDANVLIFPNLEAGNIAYKLVERLAKAKAIGPLMQGLNKPVNDLSRGCNYQDIVNVTAFTCCDCQHD